MRCKDCGAKEYEPSRRGDVCKPCMEKRVRLVQAANSGAVSIETLKSIQRTMATDIFRHGRASKKIDAALGEGGDHGDGNDGIGSGGSETERGEG